MSVTDGRQWVIEGTCSKDLQLPSVESYCLEGMEISCFSYLFDTNCTFTHLLSFCILSY